MKNRNWFGNLQDFDKNIVRNFCDDSDSWHPRQMGILLKKWNEITITFIDFLILLKIWNWLGNFQDFDKNIFTNMCDDFGTWNRRQMGNLFEYNWLTSETHKVILMFLRIRNWLWNLQDFDKTIFRNLCDDFGIWMHRQMGI